MTPPRRSNGSNGVSPPPLRESLRTAVESALLHTKLGKVALFRARLDSISHKDAMDYVSDELARDIHAALAETEAALELVAGWLDSAGPEGRP